MAELSPAARAVLDAFNDANDGHYEDDTWHPPEVEHQLAAALRAAAEELQYRLFLPGNDLDIVESRTIFKLANELEGADE